MFDNLMFIEYTDEVPGRTNREAVVSFPQNTVLPTADKTDPNSKIKCKYTRPSGPTLKIIAQDAN